MCLHGKEKEELDKGTREMSKQTRTRRAHGDFPKACLPSSCHLTRAAGGFHEGRSKGRPVSSACWYQQARSALLSVVKVILRDHTIGMNVVNGDFPIKENTIE